MIHRLFVALFSGMLVLLSVLALGHAQTVTSAPATSQPTALDWTVLLTPLIVAVIPMLVSIAKRVIPPRFAVLYPVLAASLGPVLEYLSTFLSQQPASPGRGVLMGMAAVALREILDQLRKIPPAPPTRRAWFLLLALPLVGCAGVNTMGGLDAAQLRELAKVKDAACTKVTGVYMGATITVTAINVDKGIPTSGGTVKIGPDCATEITAESKGEITR